MKLIEIAMKKMKLWTLTAILILCGATHTGAQTRSDSIYVEPELLPNACYFLPAPPSSTCLQLHVPSMQTSPLASYQKAIPPNRPQFEPTASTALLLQTICAASSLKTSKRCSGDSHRCFTLTRHIETVCFARGNKLFHTGNKKFRVGNFAFQSIIQAKSSRFLLFSLPLHSI